jgi:HEAT repeat protein
MALLLAALLAPRAALGEDAATLPAALEAVLPLGDEGFPSPPGPITPAAPLNMTTARTVGLLADAIDKAPTPADRARLVADLGECKRTEAIAPLALAMKSDHPLVRAQAARSVAVMATENRLLDALSPLAGDLATLAADASPSVRREAVLAADAIGAHDVIARALGDSDATVLVAACRCASTPQHAQLIAQRIGAWPAPVQIQACAALGRLKPDAAGAALAPLLGGPVPIRAAALRALGQAASTRQAPAVQSCLSAREHPTVRREALLALVGVTDKPTQSARARVALDDPDPTVRQAAAQVLAAAPSADALPQLVKLLSDAYDPAYLAARQALVAIGQQALDAAAQLLASDHPRRREDGSYVLGHLRSRHALGPHAALLGETDKPQPDWPLVSQVARSLAMIGDRQAGPPVAEALRVTRRKLAAASPVGPGTITEAFVELSVAAGRLGEKSVLSTLIPMIPDKAGQSADARCAAVWAFGVLGELPANENTAGRLLSIYSDPEDADEVKLEALKALGHLRDRRDALRLRDIGSAKGDSTPSLRWMAHWAADRIAARVTAYVPPDRPWTADTTIADVPKPRGSQ